MGRLGSVCAGLSTEHFSPAANDLRVSGRIVFLYPFPAISRSVLCKRSIGRCWH
jgi:hypothetical protein